MQKITPFLWFDGQAEEAVKFYVSIFRNSRVISVTRHGTGRPRSKAKVMSATFQLEGQRFFALNGGPHFQFSPAAERNSGADGSRTSTAFPGRSSRAFWARCLKIGTRNGHPGS